MREITNIPDFAVRFLERPNTPLLGRITLQDILPIIQGIIETCGSLPTVQVLNNNFKDTIVVGDIHGDIITMSKLVKNFLEEKINSIIFLGDYVDRGERSLEVLLLGYCLKLAFPERICILRGNHEDININKKYGFYKDIINNFGSDGEEMMNKFNESYNYLSILAITPNRSLCMHGGISEKTIFLTDFNSVKKPYSNLITRSKKKEIINITQSSTRSKANIAVVTPRNELFNFADDHLINTNRTNDETTRRLTTLEIPKIGIEEKNNKLILNAIYEIMWNDPNTDISDFGSSKRGNTAFNFGEDALNNFLDINNLERVIRAHEYSRGAYQKVFPRLIHIFSSGPYNTKHTQALLVHENDGETNIVNLDLKPVYFDV